MFPRISNVFRKILSSFKNKEKVIVLSGPTGSGKTALSIKVAHRLNGEVINADSIQLYKELNIGSNKVQADEMQGVRHHLLDVFHIGEDHVDAQQFFRLAREATNDILKRNKVPILVGGSGFYLRSYLNGLSGAKSDLEKTYKLEEELKNLGWEKSIQRLMMRDEEYAKTLCKNDFYRLARAIEIVERTGKKMNQFEHFIGTLPFEQLDFDFRCILLYRDRLNLYKSIDKRCEEMIERGLFEEVIPLYKLGLFKEKTPPYRAIGYNEVIQFLKNSNFPIQKEDFLNFLSEFKKASRNYARRQYQWFRKEKKFFWLNCDGKSMEQLVENIIELYEIPFKEYKNRVLGEENLTFMEKMKGEPSFSPSQKEEKRQYYAALNAMYIYEDAEILERRIDKINQLVNEMRIGK